MTILNIISITVAVALIAAAVIIHRIAKRKADSADGLGNVNQRGRDGLSYEGIEVSELGETDGPSDDAPDDVTRG